MERINKTYIITKSNEIYQGLAFEQVLYLYAVEQARQQQKPEQVLCMWRSKSAVVMGRNQNPVLECNYPFLRDNNVALARRDSGGGTVYQDEHNLNFCFIQHSDISIITNLEFLRNILEKLGIPCTIDEKNNILSNGKKISGSAFRYGQGVQMHHFTLLLNTDLDKLHKSLHPEHGLQVESIGIDSHRMPVTNLQLSVGVIEEVIQTLDCIDEIIYIEDDHDLQSIHPKRFIEEVKRLQTPEWIFERTPNFSLIFSMDNQEYCVTIKKGKITQMKNMLQEIPIENDYYFFLPQKSVIKETKGYDIIENVIEELRKNIFGGIII